MIERAVSAAPSGTSSFCYAPEPTREPLRLLGVRVDDISANELINVIALRIANRQRCVIVNSNAHLVNLARTRPWLVRLFDTADIAFCDGAGVQFAIWLITGRKLARHTPPEWIEALAKRLAADNATVFWLGGRRGVAAEAAALLTAKTGVTVVGHHHGFFDTTTGGDENEAVIARINAARPALLLINMGMPLQERWLHENWPRLNTCAAVTAGALVDHVAGRTSRPPAWVADAGLEWLIRLVREPRRLWRRYLLGLPFFAARVLVAAGSTGPRHAVKDYAGSSQCAKISTAISSPTEPSPQIAD